MPTDDGRARPMEWVVKIAAQMIGAERVMDGVAKKTYFEIAVGVQEKIGWFQVAVKDIGGVECFQCS